MLVVFLSSFPLWNTLAQPLLPLLAFSKFENLQNLLSVWGILRVVHFYNPLSTLDWRGR